MSGDSAQVRCPLCGGSFPARAACPQGCPLAVRCRSLCCPHCHYSFVAEDSRLARWLRALVGGRQS